ncbi:MAG: DUF2079 domain-containing protein [Bacteroidota bacterium]
MFKPNLNKNQPFIIGKGIVFFLACLQLFIVLFNHYNFRTFTFDYGVYNFAFFDFAHGRLSNCPMALVFDSRSNFLQDHFSLTLPLLSPLFWLFQNVTGTYTLLFFQWLFIIYGAWATYRLVELKCNQKGLALLSLLYYFVLYGRYSAYQNDCNLAIIGAAMIPVFLYYFEAKKTLPAFLAFFFLIINREDFSLCLIFISFYLAYNHRKNRKMLGLAFLFAFLSMLSFICIFQILIPLVEGANHQYRLFEYSILGANPKEAIQFMIVHPIQTIKYLFVNHTNETYSDNIKMGFYLVYGFSGGVLLLWRPINLLFLLPFIAKKMFNDYNNRWGYEMYYSIEIATILPLLVFNLIGEKFSAKWRIPVGSSVLVIATTVTLYCLSIANYPNPYQKFNILKFDYYKVDAETSMAHYLIHQIPDKAAVCASSRVLPHLAFREKIYHFPDVRDAEYICVMKEGDTYPYSKQKFDSTLKSFVNKGLWIVKYDLNNFLVLHRKAQ